MAKGAVRCTGCNTPLAFHCPPTNSTCTWLACLHPQCDVRYYDISRGLLQHTNGTVTSWADMPATTQPPTVTIDDETDGRPTTPDA